MPKAKPADARRWASLDQAADYYGVHKMTVRRWIAAGKIAGYRVGPQQIRVDLNETDATLAERIPAAKKAGR